MKRLLSVLAILALLALFAGALGEGGMETISLEDLTGGLAGATFAGEPGAIDGIAANEAELTVMVYICGSNLESGSEHWATKDLAEMCRSGFDESRVNVAVALGGASAWGMSDIRTDVVTEMCLYPSRGSATIYNRQPGASMGDARTLSTFLRNAVAVCPARRYALVIWNHGGGPVGEMCLDELSGDSMVTQELVAALADSPFGGELKLDWIGMNACLMASAEICDALSPYADYLFASEDVLIAPDFDYRFLRDVANQDSETVGRAIVDGYFETYEDYWLINSESANMMMAYLFADRTMSVIDLRRIDAVEQAVDALFAAVPSPVQESDFVQLARARSGAVEFGLVSGSHLDLVDLTSLANAYAPFAPEQAAALKAAVGEAVVYNRTNMEGASGLSIYYPNSNLLYYYYLWKDQMTANGFGGSYLDFVSTYIDKAYETSVDWSGLYDTLTLSARQEGEGYVATLTLDPKQQEYAYSAQLITLQGGKLLKSEGGYHLFGHQNHAGLYGNMLMIDYDGKSMALLDADGNVVNEVNSVWRDGYYFVSACLADRPMQEYDGTERLQHVWLVLRENDYGGLDLVNLVPSERGEVAPSDEKVNASFSGLTLDSETWPVVYLFSNSTQPKYNDKGELLPADTWPTAGEVNDMDTVLSYICVDNTQPWQLGFAPLPDDIYGRYAQVVVTDICGQRHASPLVELPNRCKLAAARPEQALYSESGCGVALEEVSLVRDDINGYRGMLLTLQIDNPTDWDLWYDFSNVRFNGVDQVTRLSWTDDEGNPQQVDTGLGISDIAWAQSDSRVSLFLDLTDLEGALPERIERLGFEVSIALREPGEVLEDAVEPFRDSLELTVDLNTQGLLTD